ncbi:hypothetical protein VNO77_01582 [Canavalia gladiata]|uniref:Uncharacterized protein n=1 Tax=Canavalia gladiata TaxID=3824 RepID=A0AAN9MRE7_CANGL
MESTISQCYCAPLNLSYGSKLSQYARPSNFHLRFNHATSLCLPNFSITRHQIARPFRHANCMLETFSLPSENEGSDNKVLRGVTQVSLVLACVIGLFNFSSKMNPKITTAYACDPSSTTEKIGKNYDLSMIQNTNKGRVVVGELLKMLNEAEESTEANQSLPKFDQQAPSVADIDAFKMIAMRLPEPEIRARALEKLQRQYNKTQNDQSKEKLRFSLAEFLIFQENFEEARKWLDEQINIELAYEKAQTPKEKCDKLLEKYTDPQISNKEQIKIARLLFYKAIVHSMLEDKEGKGKEGREWWKSGEAVDHKGKEAVEWRKAFIQTL